MEKTGMESRTSSQDVFARRLSTQRADCWLTKSMDGFGQKSLVTGRKYKHIQTLCFVASGRVPFTLALTLWKHCEWPWSKKSSVAFWSKAKNNASIKNCKANSQPILHSRDVSFSPAHIRWSPGKVHVWLDQRHWHEYWSPNVFYKECLHFFIINLT